MTTPWYNVALLASFPESKKKNNDNKQRNYIITSVVCNVKECSNSFWFEWFIIV